MKELVAKTPLSKFTADYTLDLCRINGLRTRDSLGNLNKREVDESLDRLEAFYKKRRKH